MQWKHSWKDNPEWEASQGIGRFIAKLFLSHFHKIWEVVAGRLCVRNFPCVSVVWYSLNSHLKKICTIYMSFLLSSALIICGVSQGSILGPIVLSLFCERHQHLHFISPWNPAASPHLFYFLNDAKHNVRICLFNCKAPGSSSANSPYTGYKILMINVFEMPGYKNISETVLSITSLRKVHESPNTEVSKCFYNNLFSF